jgi:hypothetical protein
MQRTEIDSQFWLPITIAAPALFDIVTRLIDDYWNNHGCSALSFCGLSIGKTTAEQSKQLYCSSLRQWIATTTSNNKLLAVNSAPTNSNNNNNIPPTSNHFVHQRCHCSLLLLFEFACCCWWCSLLLWKPEKQSTTTTSVIGSKRHFEICPCRQCSLTQRQQQCNNNHPQPNCIPDCCVVLFFCTAVVKCLVKNFTKQTPAAAQNSTPSVRDCYVVLLFCQTSTNKSNSLLKALKHPFPNQKPSRFRQLQVELETFRCMEARWTASVVWSVPPAGWAALQ